MIKIQTNCTSVKKEKSAVHEKKFLFTSNVFRENKQKGIYLLNLALKIHKKLKVNQKFYISHIS